MSHLKLTITAALLILTTGQRAAAQCISATCPGDGTQFVSNPIMDQIVGSVPFTRSTLSVSQFDPAFYAGIHDTTPGAISLLGVSVDFFASIDPLIRLDTGASGSACSASWNYDTGAVIFTNPVVGNPGTLVFANESGVASLPNANGPPPPWDVTINPSASVDAFCFAVTSGFGPWIGTGQVEFQTDSLANGATTGCAVLLTEFSNVSTLRATVYYVYCVDDGGGGAVGTPFCFCDGSGTAPPCGNAGAPGAGCANSTGSGAVLTAAGSNSTSADDITFQSTNVLPNQPALLFAGLNAVGGGSGVVFGDGLRCAGGTVTRLGVRIPNAQGTANWGPGLGVTGGWGAGDTRRFQTWYRNPGGQPCGSNFNLTNGFEVNFMP